MAFLGKKTGEFTKGESATSFYSIISRHPAER